MWLVIRFCTWISDVTLVTSQVMKVSHVALHHLPPSPHQIPMTVVKNDLPIADDDVCKVGLQSVFCKVCIATTSG